MKGLFLFILIIFLCQDLNAQDSFYINASPGISFVSPLPLIINKEGYKRISFWAKYNTRSLKLPIYYSLRVGKINDNKGLELELNHLKIYLNNTSTAVSRFSISHGYNQLFVNRIFYKDKSGKKAGLGLVIAHPENTIHGEILNENNGIFGKGYYVAGPAFQYGIFKEASLTKWLYILIEVRASIAYANIPVVEGRAHVPVLAFHLQIGPGFKLQK